VAVMSASSLMSMFNAFRRSRSVGKQRAGMQNPIPWHALTADGVLARLDALESGLSAKKLPPPSRKLDLRALENISRAVTQEMSNPLTPLLAMGAGVSAMVGSKADAGIVAGVALINGIIGGVQRFRTERNISNLIQTAENKVKVVRDGTTEICPAASLQVGDIVLLSRGDAVPADCRILESDALEVDTSSLTGESLPAAKSAEPCFAENIADITSMLFEGNYIAAGHARAAVTAVGDQTATARAGALSVVDEERGGVEARLKELMNLTGPITIAAGAALLGTGMLRGKRIEDLVSTAVGLAVAAVPEGLPLLATAAQLAAAERLSLRGALVKNARAIEALGRVDTLCMDKTGTLTEGRIALSSLFDGEKTHPVENLDGRGREVLLAAVRSAAEEEGTSMDPLNAAVLRAADRYLSQEDLEEAPQEGARISMLPFDSTRGYEAVILGRGKGARMFVKGAPELLMDQSKSAALDRKVRFAGQIRRQFEEELGRLTAEGLRVIAVAEKRIMGAELEASAPRDLLEKTEQLTILGLLAFRDPVRKGAKETVDKLARAGVRVVMLTGDHPQTAAAAAEESGLMKRGPVLSGDKITAMSDEALEAAVAETSVFARVSPAQKVRIIRAFEKKKHIVGMVGDGANDAAAMRAADAGIAVGLDSAEAARASADIVLKEAHIGELFEAVVEGRAMWRSVRNAVSILVGGNLGEIAFTVAAGAVAARPPLSPRQLLVVNFLTDIAPSTAIAIRPPSVFDLHALREAGPKEALGAPLNREIAARAVCTSLGAWTAWSIARLTGTRNRASTVALLGLVGSQLGQTLLSGGKNRAVIWTSIGSVALLGAMVQTPGLSRALGCTPVGPLAWATAAGASLGSTLLSPIAEAVIQFGADKLADVPGSALIKKTVDKLLSEIEEEQPA
jgi:cation-transporting P-type ATPase I